MRILLLGGTGFIGRHLISHLLGEGHELLILSRSPRPKLEQERAAVVLGNPMAPGDWQDRVAECHAVINLVGRNIMARWTRSVKQEILESRIKSTQLAAEAMQRSSAPEPVLINASAAGYYPFSETLGTVVYDEAGPAGDHFLARVCAAWEDAAMQAASFGARVVTARFAPVLAAEEGMLQQVLPVFAKGLGGRIGSGRQPFPWVHIRDLVRALDLALTDTTIHGPMNVCSPTLVTNAQFTEAVARAVKRPAVLPVPEFALRLRFGELASMLSKGQAVTPAVLKKRDFPFMYTDIYRTLEEIAGRQA